MKINKGVFLSLIVVLIICAVKVYAGSVTMTTYYPAPTGYYDTVKVNKNFILPCYNTAPASPQTGQMWVVKAGCQ